MPKISYVNGRYVPHTDAFVHVEDRGYQFADGVYEVIAVRNGVLIDEKLHLIRLKRSLEELALESPIAESALKFIMREVIRRNRVVDGSIYLQITRGVAARDHAFPDSAGAALVVTGRKIQRPSPDTPLQPATIITVPDIRWQRCDIKSVSLLPNVLAKQQAIADGAGDAWQVDGAGMVTEGSASNAWIVTKDGELITRHLDDLILAGITRIAVSKLAKELGIKLVERAFTVEEAQSAKEAFLTSTTAFVKPVSEIDGVVVGNGEPGEITCKLHSAYLDYMDSPERLAG